MSCSSDVVEKHLCIEENIYQYQAHCQSNPNSEIEGTTNRSSELQTWLVKRLNHLLTTQDSRCRQEIFHSTIHWTIRYDERNEQETNRYMIFLDIDKAFDSVWRDGFTFKLLKMKLPTYVTIIINSFIRNRQFEVRVSECTSRNVFIPAVLAQRTCISPNLYALFVSDMPIIDKIETALSADETAFYTLASVLIPSSTDPTVRQTSSWFFMSTLSNGKLSRTKTRLRQSCSPLIANASLALFYWGSDNMLLNRLVQSTTWGWTWKKCYS